MYGTVVTIGKISSDRMNQRWGLIRPEGTYVPDSDHRSIHYPAYCNMKKKLDTVCLG